MKFDLNNEQSNELAKFFLDLGKGFFLATIGVATVSDTKIAVISIGIIFAAICVLSGLYLLRKLE
ncbi:MAG: hypothetical protein AAB948_02990 [Patescibacteria group bacterium]